MQLDIPFFSQLDEQVPVELQRSMCAIACVKMILDSRGIEHSFAHLFREAEIVGGREAAGWNHETIVRVLRNHGVLSYRQEFLAHTIDLETLMPRVADHSDDFAEKGVSKIRKSITDGMPVIVSVLAGFSQDNKTRKSVNLGHHMVLVTGYDDDGLVVHDPIFPQGSEGKVSYEHFMTCWRRFAIFVDA